MKRLLGWIALGLVAVMAFVIVTDRRKTYYDIASDNSDIEIKIRYKGLKKAEDFTMDDNNIYVAYPTKIMCIPLSGEPYELISDDTYNIDTMELVGEKLFFITNNKLMSVHIRTKSLEECIDDLPNIGDYQHIVLKGYGDYLYIAIGSATNSGVVGEDNEWTSSNEDGHDLSPYKIKLNEYGKTAFCSKNSDGNKDGIVPAEKIGNSSILELNVNTMEYKNYAWGIRNIMGMDITSDGRIFATVGGCENRGSRPVIGDSDYIYEIKKGCWYGFPDFSGGDPLNSPRFYDNENKTNQLIMSEYPMTPLSPSYQHDSLGSLKWLFIDNGGIINKTDKDNIYFYDSISKEIYHCSINGSPEKFTSFKGGTNITMMKILNESLYILDGNKGILYTLNIKSNQ